MQSRLGGLSSILARNKQKSNNKENKESSGSRSRDVPNSPESFFSPPLPPAPPPLQTLPPPQTAFPYPNNRFPWPLGPHQKEKTDKQLQQQQQQQQLQQQQQQFKNQPGANTAPPFTNLGFGGGGPSSSSSSSSPVPLQNSSTSTVVIGASTGNQLNNAPGSANNLNYASQPPDGSSRANSSKSADPAPPQQQQYVPAPVLNTSAPSPPATGLGASSSQAGASSSGGGGLQLDVNLDFTGESLFDGLSIFDKPRSRTGSTRSGFVAHTQGRSLPSTPPIAGNANNATAAASSSRANSPSLRATRAAPTPPSAIQIPQIPQIPPSFKPPIPASSSRNIDNNINNISTSNTNKPLPSPRNAAQPPQPQQPPPQPQPPQLQLQPQPQHPFFPPRNLTASPTLSYLSAYSDDTSSSVYSYTSAPELDMDYFGLNSAVLPGFGALRDGGRSGGALGLQFGSDDGEDTVENNGGGGGGGAGSGAEREGTTRGLQGEGGDATEGATGADGAEGAAARKRPVKGKRPPPVSKGIMRDTTWSRHSRTLTRQDSAVLPHDPWWFDVQGGPDPFTNNNNNDASRRSRSKAPSVHSARSRKSRRTNSVTSTYTFYANAKDATAAGAASQSNLAALNLSTPTTSDIMNLYTGGSASGSGQYSPSAYAAYAALAGASHPPSSFAASASRRNSTRYPHGHLSHVSSSSSRRSSTKRRRNGGGAHSRRGSAGSVSIGGAGAAAAAAAERERASATWSVLSGATAASGSGSGARQSTASSGASLSSGGGGQWAGWWGEITRAIAGSSGSGGAEAGAPTSATSASSPPALGSASLSGRFPSHIEPMPEGAAQIAAEASKIPPNALVRGSGGMGVKGKGGAGAGVGVYGSAADDRKKSLKSSGAGGGASGESSTSPIKSPIGRAPPPSLLLPSLPPPREDGDKDKDGAETNAGGLLLRSYSTPPDAKQHEQEREREREDHRDGGGGGGSTSEHLHPLLPRSQTDPNDNIHGRVRPPPLERLQTSDGATATNATNQRDGSSHSHSHSVSVSVSDTDSEEIHLRVDNDGNDDEVTLHSALLGYNTPTALKHQPGGYLYQQQQHAYQQSQQHNDSPTLLPPRGPSSLSRMHGSVGSGSIDNVYASNAGGIARSWSATGASSGGEVGGGEGAGTSTGLMAGEDAGSDGLFPSPKRKIVMATEPPALVAAAAAATEYTTPFDTVDGARREDWQSAAAATTGAAGSSSPPPPHSALGSPQDDAMRMAVGTRPRARSSTTAPSRVVPRGSRILSPSPTARRASLRPESYLHLNIYEQGQGQGQGQGNRRSPTLESIVSMADTLASSMYANPSSGPSSLLGSLREGGTPPLPPPPPPMPPYPSSGLGGGIGAAGSESSAGGGGGGGQIVRGGGGDAEFVMVGKWGEDGDIVSITAGEEEKDDARRSPSVSPGRVRPPNAFTLTPPTKRRPSLRGHHHAQESIGSVSGMLSRNTTARPLPTAPGRVTKGSPSGASFSSSIGGGTTAGMNGRAGTPDSNRSLGASSKHTRPLPSPRRNANDSPASSPRRRHEDAGDGGFLDLEDDVGEDAKSFVQESVVVRNRMAERNASAASLGQKSSVSATQAQAQGLQGQGQQGHQLVQTPTSSISNYSNVSSTSSPVGPPNGMASAAVAVTVSVSNLVPASTSTSALNVSGSAHGASASGGGSSGAPTGPSTSTHSLNSSTHSLSQSSVSMQGASPASRRRPSNAGHPFMPDGTSPVPVAPSHRVSANTLSGGLGSISRRLSNNNAAARMLPIGPGKQQPGGSKVQSDAKPSSSTSGSSHSFNNHRKEGSAAGTGSNATGSGVTTGMPHRPTALIFHHNKAATTNSADFPQTPAIFSPMLTPEAHKRGDVDTAAAAPDASLGQRLSNLISPTLVSVPPRNKMPLPPVIENVPTAAKKRLMGPRERPAKRPGMSGRSVSGSSSTVASTTGSGQTTPALVNNLPMTATPLGGICGSGPPLQPPPPSTSPTIVPGPSTGVTTATSLSPQTTTTPQTSPPLLALSTIPGVGVGTGIGSSNLSPASPRFYTRQVAWRGLTMDAAKWTFTSGQLQEIVGRAIRQTAEASSIRLLTIDQLDLEIPNEIRRLEAIQQEVTQRYRAAVRRRRILYRTLAIQADRGRDDPQARQELHDISVMCDQLTEELFHVMDELSQLHRLRDVHSSSALAMALRKLNSSFLKQSEAAVEMSKTLSQLEAEKDEAWATAERVERELIEVQAKYDALITNNANGETSHNANGTPTSSARSSRVSAARKTSIRASKASLRLSRGTRLSVASNNALSGVSPSVMPPVPPIPRSRDFASSRTLSVNTADLPTASEYSTGSNSPTRALAEAQKELYDMLGFSPADSRTGSRYISMYSTGSGRNRRVSEVISPASLPGSPCAGSSSNGGTRPTSEVGGPGPLRRTASFTVHQRTLPHGNMF